MKRGLSVSVLCACAAAGLFTALALADDTPPGGTTTTTTTAPAAQSLPEGVTIGGIPVGGLPPADAASAIRDYFSYPLELDYGGRAFSADPDQLAAPNVAPALERAKAAQPFANVTLVVVVRPGRIRSFVASLAAKIDQAPSDSRLLLRGVKPYVTPDRPGLALERRLAVNAMTKELEQNGRDAIQLQAKPVRAKVTRASLGPVIVIRRGSNRLYLYRGMRLQHVFAVASGQRVYPTPLGRFQIVVKWKNPWWYPPPDPWAVGEKPTPPGPGNPLGTRWMGLSAPGVGIHGTNNDSSIGYSVSHGCIRMHVRDAEWLFNHVEIGTTVFIVAA